MMTLLKLEVQTMMETNELKMRVEALMQKVETMERGGDLEGLLEKEISVLKKEIYEAALQTRQNQTAKQADFSPSGLSEV